MKLYRANIALCHSFYSLLNLFEVALRNSIDGHYQSQTGDSEWLLHACQPTGFLDNVNTSKTRDEILRTFTDLGSRYTHDRLIAALSFGIWRYFFNKHQFIQGGRTLHFIFPNYPLVLPNPYKSPVDIAQADLYKRLGKINSLRNRIAHLEPICFDLGGTQISDLYAVDHYQLIQDLVDEMGINSKELFYGLDDFPKSLQRLRSV